MNQKGMTLLEFIIAFAILVVVLAAVYITQSSSLFSSVRTKNLIIATNLARNLIAESYKLEGQPFDNLKDDTGDFDKPYEGYKWSRKVEELDFSTLTQLITKKAQEKDSLHGVANEQTILLKAFEDYLKKSVRKVTLTIEWSEGGSESSKLSFTELLVNYDADFAPTL